MNALASQAAVRSWSPLLSPAEPLSRAAFDGPPKVDLVTHVRAACPSLLGLPRLARDVLALARGPGRLSPAEYFHHRLWDPEFVLGDKRAFVGKVRQGELHRACNAAEWVPFAGDKILTHAILQDAGITQLPRVKAVSSQDRRVGDSRILESCGGLAGFLCDPGSYPFFAKPVAGIYSLGTFHAVRHDAAADTVVLANGAPRPLEAIIQAVVDRPGGYVFQDVLTPAAPVAALTGGRLCSVRLLVLLTRGAPRIRSAAIKIPTGSNVADNYWRPGNRLGAIELATGMIARVVTGTGLELRRDPVHPDTGRRIEGEILPEWREVCRLVLAIARLFPGIRTQSWDIALTDHGPIILELNWGGDLHLHQLAHGRGMLDPAYQQHVAAASSETADPPPLPARSLG